MSTDSFKQAIQEVINLVTNDPEWKSKSEDLLHINGFADFLKTFPLLWWLLKRLVGAVELVYNEFNLISAEERIQVAADALDDLVNFTGWLSIFEPFDGFLFKALISAAVAALNDKLGHSWFTLAVSKNNLEKLAMVAS